jgi:hypothetical protein
MKSLLCAFVLCVAVPAQWVMVVNNTFLGAPNNSSVALLNRANGTLVNRDWIVPAAGTGNWNGNCSAQDAVQVGSQVWVGSSNANCAMPAAIYIYDVAFGGPVPVATFNSARFLTVADVGIDSTQPRGLYWNAALGIVTMSDGNGIHALDTSCNYLGTSLPGNCWGMTLLHTGELVYSVISFGGILRASPNLATSLGTFASSGTTGFWPYELDVNLAGNLVASGFASSGYNVREWSPAGVLIGDPYPGTANLRGMAVLDDGSYLLSRNAFPFDLIRWDGATASTIIADTGPNTPAQATFSGYMMGTLDVPTAPLSLAIGQPGPGSFGLVNGGLLNGVDSFNAFSLEPAPGGPGTGPYLGLYTAFPAQLIAEVLVPPGTLPFHFIAVRPSFQFSVPSGVPPGLTVEMVAFEIVNGAIGRFSPVATTVTF